MNAPNFEIQVERESRRIQNAYKQDKDIPFLINLDDARLVPNNVNTRDLPDYRPYHGDVNWDLEKRKAWVTQMLRTGGRVRVVDTSPEDTVFDLAKATKEQIAEFAKREYALELALDTDIRTMRRKVMEAEEARSKSDSMA